MMFGRVYVDCVAMRCEARRGDVLSQNTTPGDHKSISYWLVCLNEESGRATMLVGSKGRFQIGAYLLVLSPTNQPNNRLDNRSYDSRETPPARQPTSPNGVG